MRFTPSLPAPCPMASEPPCTPRLSMARAKWLWPGVAGCVLRRPSLRVELRRCEDMPCRLECGLISPATAVAVEPSFPRRLSLCVSATRICHRGNQVPCGWPGAGHNEQGHPWQGAFFARETSLLHSGEIGRRALSQTKAAKQYVGKCRASLERGRPTTTCGV